MKTKVYILALFLTLMASCRNDFDFQTERLNGFQKDFVDMYGWPHSAQNWNTAAQYKLSVAVEEGGAWSLRVFTANPYKEAAKSYLIGDFSIDTAESDTVEVLVDGPYTLQSMYVAIGNGTSVAGIDVVPDKDFCVEAFFENKDMRRGTLPSTTSMSYFIIYEVADSSNTYLDYNDIVLEVAHVSGRETADVKLRAVGAKVEMNVSYDEDDGSSTMLFENVHKVFGYLRSDKLINVESGQHDIRTPKLYSNLNVGKDFSILQHAYRFVVTLTEKKKWGQFAVFPNREVFYGIPANAICVANPKWDWVSETDAVEKRHKSFPFWVLSYHLYNTWWDSLWDPHELVLMKDGKTYQPDFDYTDLIYDAPTLEQMGDSIPNISFERLMPYTNTEIGANIGFSITGRNQGKIKISFERTDGGIFEWYEDLAYVTVQDRNFGVDAGIDCYAEACHILLSTKTMQQIVDTKSALRVIFDPGETETRINSVWIRER